MTPRCIQSRRGRQLGISLAEVLIALAIGAVMMTAITLGFMQSMRRSQWSAFSLAANSLALQRLEQTRAANWDTDLVATNFPTQTQVLDVSFNKTNLVYATNTTTILTLSTNPPLKMVRVDCVWRFLSRGLFTNSVVTYRAPDA